MFKRLGFECFLRKIVRVESDTARKVVTQITMSKSKRFFPNIMQDYQGGAIQFSDQTYKSRIMQFVSNIVEKHPPSDTRNNDGGLYVGTGGIAYMLYHMGRAEAFDEQLGELQGRALEYIGSALQCLEDKRVKNDPSQKSAFLLGNAGIYAVAGVIYNSVGERNKAERYIKTYVESSSNCKPVNFLLHGGDELFVGRAGFLCGALWLRKMLGQQVVPTKDIFDICASIIQSGRSHAKLRKSPCPLMYSYYDTEYLGAAHGLCAILQMLLSFPEFLEIDHSAQKDVQATVEFMLNLQTETGNFPCAMDETGRRSRSECDELVHWCHGAPGVVYLMAKAYLLWKDTKYLESCLKCGELVWKKGLLRKGPGICHGVAGSGYVFLLLYRLTGDQKHLYRAHAFAEFLYTPEFQKARTPDCPYSLYEGLAGTVCFLTDLMQPEKACFPFFDIF